MPTTPIRLSLTVLLLIAVNVRCTPTTSDIHNGANCTDKWFCRFESKSTDQFDESYRQYVDKYLVVEDTFIDTKIVDYYKNNKSGDLPYVVFDPCSVHFKADTKFLGDDRDVIFPEDGGTTPENKSYDDFQDCIEAYCKDFHKNQTKILRCNNDFNKTIHWGLLHFEPSVDGECLENIKFINLKGIKIDECEDDFAMNIGNLAPLRIDLTGFTQPITTVFKKDYDNVPVWLDVTETAENSKFIKEMITNNIGSHVVRTNLNYYFNGRVTESIYVLNRRTKCLDAYTYANLKKGLHGCENNKIVDDQSVDVDPYETALRSKCEAAKQAKLATKPTPTVQPLLTSGETKRDANERETNYERLTDEIVEKTVPTVRPQAKTTEKSQLIAEPQTKPEQIIGDKLFIGFVFGVCGLGVAVLILKFLRT